MIVHPTGPNVVVKISEVGNCKGDCGKSRFVIDTFFSQAQLVLSIPREEVRKKFEVVNEGFGKRAAPWYIWLVFLPWLVAGLIFVADIETSPNGGRCTNITRVCSVGTNSSDLSTCNKIWCCFSQHQGFSRRWTDTNEWISEDFEGHGCEALAGNHTLENKEDKETIAGLCEEKFLMQHCSCKEKGAGDRPVCGVVRIQGRKGNFEIYRNRPNLQALGAILLHMVWSFQLTSYCFFLYRTCMQKRFIKESFEDWKRIYGIETKYETKYCIPYTGMLYLILPIPADEHAVEGKTITKIRNIPVHQ